ncbi:MAG: carbohydrate porin [Planctomycetes bacterium]|nr:carbohydrate porin [Planctomycetota bacterium]
MVKVKIALIILLLFSMVKFSQASDINAENMHRPADNGLEFQLGVTSVYQQNVRSGISKHRRAGRISGSYDLELISSLERLVGIEGGTVYMHAEGRWSKAQGVDGPSIGSAFGVNADGGARRTMDVAELWYEQSMFGGALILRVGKMDITGGFECRGCPVSFDGSSFANDETSQFLNGALVNNPTIPFPDYGLGLVLHYNPVEWWYVSGGVIDAQADGRETGFRTTFHDEDYFVYLLETGVTPQMDSVNGPLQGAYRVGLWNDAQPKSNPDNSKNSRGDVGFYLSCDQMLAKENAGAEDSQGLGAFFRYGYASGRRNDITDFWSAGFQYQGIFDGRDDDVLGVGFAHGSFSDSADTTYTADYESVLEIYYNAEVSSWLNISPNIQYITNPGGNRAISNAVVLGVRAQMSF